MRRMVLVTAAVLLAALAALGAVEDPREILKGYLLTAEQVGQGWERIDRAIETEPEGAIAVGAFYNKGNLQLTSTLFQFGDLYGAMEYFFALKVDAGPNIREITEEGLAEELFIFQSGGGDQALSFRQGRIISIFLASPQVDLLRLVEIQLEQIRGGQ